MKNILYIILFLSFQLVNSQREFHVFPENHKTTPGKSIGDGSLSSPWNLQTALNQTNNVVDGGDIIWLHDGVYNGRYISKLKSSTENNHIVVSARNKGKVILNGNVTSSLKAVLRVTGRNVIYRDFNITFLGDFPRNAKDKNFKKVAGIDHTSGVNCKFINLQIHDVPGIGIGSWNKTGGTVIESCFIYNNGFIDKNGKGGGEGMYIQNSSDNEIRIISNNIIFNSYYKAIEVWSANRDANREYVKNIILVNNVIFNSGLPSGYTVDNIIVASDDRNGVNIAKNIKVLNNILYHNTNFLENKVSGNAASLTLGFHNKAPVRNIEVKDNIIIGRNNALRLLHIESLKFSDNIVYSGYIHTNEKALRFTNSNNSSFNNNSFFTKNNTPFLYPKGNKQTLNSIDKTFNIANNNFKNTKEFDLEPILDISKIEFSEHAFRVTIFNKKEEDVIVNFTTREIKDGMRYTVRDVENHTKVLKTGIISKDKKIEFPMKLNKDSKNKTLDNFGVFIVEFEKPEKERIGFLRRIFGWMF